MGWLCLMEGIVFDVIDEDSYLLNTVTGECLALDPIATLLLQASLQCSTQADALEYLHTYIDASDEELEEGLQSLIQSLIPAGFISLEQSALSPSLIPPAQLQNKPGQAPLQAGSADTIRSQQQGRKQPPGVDWEVFLTGALINKIGRAHV